MNDYIYIYIFNFKNLQFEISHFLSPSFVTECNKINNIQNSCFLLIFICCFFKPMHFIFDLHNIPVKKAQHNHPALTDKLLRQKKIKAKILKSDQRFGVLILRHLKEHLIERKCQALTDPLKITFLRLAT